MPLSPLPKDQAMEQFTDRLLEAAQLMELSLNRDQAGLMAGHASELILWNKKINLTAIKDPMDMAEKHFIDAVAVNSFLGSEKKIMDMGSGGGFPAIPLKICDRQKEFCLVDASRKKVNFLNHLIRTLDLENTKAVHGRVEDLAKKDSHAKGYDAVISRGFAGLEKFVALALPMLKPNGKIYALKGNAENEITQDMKAAFEIQIDHYILPFEKSHRYLIGLKQR